MNSYGNALVFASHHDLGAPKADDRLKDICSASPEEDGSEGTPCPSRPEAVKRMAPVKALRLVKAGRAPRGMKAIVERRGKRLHFAVRAGAKRIPLGDVALGATEIPFKVRHQLRKVQWDPKGRALAFRVRITHDRDTFTDAWYPYLLPSASGASPQGAPTPAVAASGSGIPDCDRFFAFMQCMLDHMTPEQRASKDGQDAAKGLATMRRQVPTLKTPRERADIAKVCRSTAAEVRSAIQGQPQFRPCLK